MILFWKVTRVWFYFKWRSSPESAAWLPASAVSHLCWLGPREVPTLAGLEGLRKLGRASSVSLSLSAAAALSHFLLQGRILSYHSSAKGSGTVPDSGLMLLYLKIEFVVVKQGDPAPILWSWWFKLEAGSEVIFKEGEGCGWDLTSAPLVMVPANTLSPFGWGNQALLAQESRSMCGSCRGSSACVLWPLWACCSPYPSCKSGCFHDVIWIGLTPCQAFFSTSKGEFSLFGKKQAAFLILLWTPAETGNLRAAGTQAFSIPPGSPSSGSVHGRGANSAANSGLTNKSGQSQNLVSCALSISLPPAASCMGLHFFNLVSLYAFQYLPRSSPETAGFWVSIGSCASNLWTALSQQVPWDPYCLTGI